MINYTILNSIIDNDLYTFTVGQLVFHLFPRAIVNYEFFNRGKTQFPEGFGKELQEQIIEMQTLRLTLDESDWMRTIQYMRPTYIDWLRGYRLNPSEVSIHQTGGDLNIKICGPWYRTIFWEVCLMAVISELYFKMTGQIKCKDWEDRMFEKTTKLRDAGCHWIDFGTRRRYSFDTQSRLVDIMKNTVGFLGTSNAYLAYKYGVTPNGTYSHQGPMAMSALYGIRSANKMWMKHWSEHYEGNVGVALTDTFTTKLFLQDFSSYEARLFDGTRQDSGDEYVWGKKMLDHYTNLNIPTTDKRMVFSNALDTDKYIAIDKYFRQWAKPIGGIGTHFSNDVGVKPLNMVIKLVGVDFGKGMIDVVKLSDDTSKNTGNPNVIRRVNEELNIL